MCVYSLHISPASPALWRVKLAAENYVSVQGYLEKICTFEGIVFFSLLSPLNFERKYFFFLMFSKQQTKPKFGVKVGIDGGCM